MSLKAKSQPTELDHIRDTLTDVVGIVGEIRQDVKHIKEHQAEHDRRFDQHDKRFDQHDKRFDQHDKRFDQHDKRFDQHDKRFDQHDARFDRQDKEIADIKEMLQVLLSR